jgi:hypothetical protein
MIRFSKPVLFSVAALMLLLFCLNLWMQRNTSLEHSNTSFGVGNDGYKAAYDLLSELNIRVTRSYIRPNRVPHDHRLWFIVPNFLSPTEEATKADTSDLMEWIRAGGTAVVMGDLNSQWKRLDIDESVSAGADVNTIKGDSIGAVESIRLMVGSYIENGRPFTPTARKILVPGLAHFDKAADKGHVRLTAGGKPFAIDFKIGSGWLVAIADGRFVLNSNLDKGDASLLLVDLARTLGAPDFDEHYHGLATPVSSLALLAHPRLLAVLVMALMTAFLWIGEQHSWPARLLRDRDDGPAPSIDSFVESLGVLYSRANDPRAAFRAYRASFLRRARRQVSPRIDVPEPVIIARLTRDRSLSDEVRRCIVGDESPSTETELVRAVRALESCPSLIHEARRH